MRVLAPYRASATGSQQYTAEPRQMPVTPSGEAFLTHSGAIPGSFGAALQKGRLRSHRIDTTSRAAIPCPSHVSEQWPLQTGVRSPAESRNSNLNVESPLDSRDQESAQRSHPRSTCRFLRHRRTQPPLAGRCDYFGGRAAPPQHEQPSQSAHRTANRGMALHVHLSPKGYHGHGRCDKM